MFEDFIALSGDRYYGEDKSVQQALLNLKMSPCYYSEKGRLDGRIESNFGMMRPEGYRKTIRLMELAERFKIPLILH